MKKTLLAALLSAGFVGAACAGSVLIVNGSSTTSEPGTTSSITSNLQALELAVGNTVTIADDVPLDLSPYRQIWDLRFSNSSPLTAAQQSQYKSFLQGGGGMFVMGENSFFPTRNDSVFGFVTLVGGGSIGGLVGDCDGTQTVQPPFTGPNPVTTIDWQCSGVVGSKGSGEWIAKRAATEEGSGIAWSVGDLTDAPGGALTVIFDVNFMQLNNTEPRTNLTKNLIGFVDDQVNVPEPGVLGLMGLGVAGLAAIRRRRYC